MVTLFKTNMLLGLRALKFTMKQELDFFASESSLCDLERQKVFFMVIVVESFLLRK